MTELNYLEKQKDLELIFVGKGEAHSRAARLNIGFHRAKGEIILFHHPRSVVEHGGIRYLIERSLDSNRPPSWGGFTHQFDYSHKLLKFTSWYSNQIRGAWRGILYLDHCIYFDSKLWTQDLPDIDVFEDTVLSQRLRKLCQPIILPFLSTTSAIRFETNGVWKQAIINQVLKIAFYLHIPHALMNRFYEKGLGLNSNYPGK
jgi:hypothetical protein